MCMTCGCGEPHATHGDKRNIVYGHLKKAADASKITVNLARPLADDAREL